MRRSDPWVSRHPTASSGLGGFAAALLITIGSYAGHLDQVSSASVPYLILVFGFVSTLLRFALLPSRYPAIRPRGSAAVVNGLTAGFLLAFVIVSLVPAGLGIAVSAGAILLSVVASLRVRRPG